MKEDFVNNTTAETESVEELLSHYPQGAKKSRGVARDVARRYLIIRDERDALKARLAVACHIEAGDRVIFDHAVLDQLGELDALKDELAESRAYADKLADGLPDGILPKDVELLRDANAKMAQDLNEARVALAKVNDLSALLAEARDNRDCFYDALDHLFSGVGICWDEGEPPVDDVIVELAKARVALIAITEVKPEQDNDTLQAIRCLGKMVAIARAALPPEQEA